MSRDSASGFRSWFQRAMLLTPSVNMSFQNHDSDNDDDDVDDDGINNVTSTISTEWPTNKENVGTSMSMNTDSHTNGLNPILDGGARSRRTDMYSEWCLLQEDNVRLWDCLAMLRTDSTMTSHTAIHIVTQAPNSDYFPKDVRSGFKNFFKDENQLVVEVLRLSVENQKLHAVLWVLADNPVIRVDSVLAAVFRLNDEQFREKFKFEYRPGCFSDKGMVMGHTRGNDKSSTSVLHGKRCRSSTPIRSIKPARNISERVSQSVSRRGNARTGGQNNSSNRRCRMEKLEPPRKHPDIWMMSALLAELDNPASNNSLLKMLKSQMAAYKKDSELDANEDDEDNKSDHLNNDIPQNDCIQLSHRPAKEQVRNKPKSLTRGNTQLRFTVHDITENDAPNNYSNNCYTEGSHNNNQSNEDLHDTLFTSQHSNLDFGHTLGSTTTMFPSHTISHHVYEDLIISKRKTTKPKEEGTNYPVDVFKNKHPQWRKSMAGVTRERPILPQKDTLVPLIVSTPYKLNPDMIPAYFIERQNYIKEIMCEKERKTNIYFHPIGRSEEGRNLLPAVYAHIPNIRKAPLKSRCCEGGDNKWQTEKTKCFYMNKPIACIYDKVGPQSKLLWKVAGKQRMKKNSLVSDSSTSQDGEVRNIPSAEDYTTMKSDYVEKDVIVNDLRKVSGILKKTLNKGVPRDGMNKDQGTCALMKKGLPLLGKKRYVKPLSNFINRHCTN